MTKIILFTIFTVLAIYIFLVRSNLKKMPEGVEIIAQNIEESDEKFAVTTNENLAPHANARARLAKFL